MSTFNEFNLPQELLQALSSMQYSTPTPVQAQAIPPALSGRDVIASAQTGTGKTAAFGIPLITALLKDPEAQALILAPTRELAAQILVVLRQLSANTRVSGCLLIGGVNMQQQRNRLRQNSRIVVATPGRLVDHLRERPALLRNFRYLVLDEADRMLDLGFAPQLEIVRQALPQQRQTLLFSATFPSDIAALAQKWLKDPERIALGSVTKPAENIVQSMIEIPSDAKSNALLKEINQRQGSVLVFARTKRRTDRVAIYLKDKGIPVTRIHGDRSQKQREEALAGFQRGKFRVMVATDIAARGIDILHIEHVINYDLPLVPEDYLHRIGRTARAGRSGQSLCIVAPEEKHLWRSIQKLLGNAEGLPSQSRKPFVHGRQNSERSGQRGKKQWRPRRFSRKNSSHRSERFASFA